MPNSYQPGQPQEGLFALRIEHKSPNWHTDPSLNQSLYRQKREYTDKQAFHSVPDSGAEKDFSHTWITWIGLKKTESSKGKAGCYDQKIKGETDVEQEAIHWIDIGFKNQGWKQGMNKYPQCMSWTHLQLPSVSFDKMIEEQVTLFLGRPTRESKDLVFLHLFWDCLSSVI